MQSRDKKLTDILNWATETEDVKAVLLTSSLVNPHAPVDAFSDLDVEIIFEDNAPYVSDAGWINTFGTHIATVEEDDTYFDHRHAMKMVLYEDHVKVDFKLYSKQKFLEELRRDELPEDWDIGYKILLDKEGITQGLKPPTYQAALIKKPTKQQFKQFLNDFWWDTTYMAKCLARDEIFYAKFVSENILRTDYLIPLIEWYIASQHHWNITTNKHGRLFKKYLPEETWRAVEQTFSGSAIADNWKALFNMADLVHAIGNELSVSFHYEYPSVLEAKVRDYLADIESGIG